MDRARIVQARNRRIAVIGPVAGDASISVAIEPPPAHFAPNAIAPSHDFGHAS